MHCWLKMAEPRTLIVLIVAATSWRFALKCNYLKLMVIFK